MPPLSILDLVPVCQGATPADALRHSLELARTAERLGFTRYWVAEHHNMPGIASAATAVALAHVAVATQRIRIGAFQELFPSVPTPPPDGTEI